MCLSNAQGTDGGKLLGGLGAEPRNGGIIQIGGQGHVIHLPHTACRILLTADVALVFDLRFHRIRLPTVQIRPVGIQGSESIVGNLRSAEQIRHGCAGGQRRGAHAREDLIHLGDGANVCSRQSGFFSLNDRPVVQIFSVTILADQPTRPSVLNQPLLRVILPQKQAELGAGGHHTVGLGGALRHQIVDQHADVGGRTGEDQRIPPQKLGAGVDGGDQALGGGLLITGGAVELTGAVQILHCFRFQSRKEGGGIDAVVLDGVGVAHDFRVAESLEGVQHTVLYLSRQGRRKSLQIDLVRGQSHRLHEELMAGLVGETDDLILNGGAITGARAVDLPRIHGGQMDILVNDPVGFLVGVGNVTGDLCDPIQSRLVGAAGEGDDVIVPGMNLQLIKIDGAAMDPGRRARLEPLEGQACRPKGSGQIGRRQGIVGTGFPLHRADVGVSRQIRAGGEDHRTGEKLAAGAGHNAPDDPSSVGQCIGENIGDFRLDQVQVGLILQDPLHVGGVEIPIRLHPLGADSRTLARVQRPGLDGGRISRKAHLAAQSVDLIDQMSLGGAAHGGIAGQIGHCVQGEGKQGGFASHTGGGQGGFASCVPRTDDNNIVHMLLRVRK